MNRRCFLSVVSALAFAGCGDSDSEQNGVSNPSGGDGYIEATVVNKADGDVIADPQRLLNASERLNDSVYSALNSNSGQYRIDANESDLQQILSRLNTEYNIDSGIFYISMNETVVKIRLVETT
jgi:hypothetical protein